RRRRCPSCQRFVRPCVASRQQGIHPAVAQVGEELEDFDVLRSATAAEMEQCAHDAQAQHLLCREAVPAVLTASTRHGGLEVLPLNPLMDALPPQLTELGCLGETEGDCLIHIHLLSQNGKQSYST